MKKTKDWRDGRLVMHWPRSWRGSTRTTPRPGSPLARTPGLPDRHGGDMSNEYLTVEPNARDMLQERDALIERARDLLHVPYSNSSVADGPPTPEWQAAVQKWSREARSALGES